MTQIGTERCPCFQAACALADFRDVIGAREAEPLPRLWVARWSTMLVDPLDQETPEFLRSAVVIFGESKRQTTSTSVGGLFHRPRLSFSYLLAARRLIVSASDDRLDVVAIPAAYLQRHAFELGLKDLTRAAYEIERDRAWLAALEHDPTTAKLSDVRSGRGHVFESLTRRLAAALELVNYARPVLVAEMEAMGKRLTAIEGQQHTWFRYGSFDRPVVLELGSVQRDLEALFERELWIRDWAHACDSATVWAEMALESQSLAQDSYSIEKANGMTREIDNLDELI
ncbi:MAG: hypothetical protein JKY37_15650 [Nannocystaceae bacterium]|nr:hypothetical protein [Nannocystaceae bacterium]